jgi:hypothetical protein
MIHQSCSLQGKLPRDWRPKANKQPILEHNLSLGPDDCGRKVEGCGARIKVVSYRIMWGFVMSVVSVLRTRTVD